MNIKGRGSRRKEKAPELLEFKDLQTSFYYIRGAGGRVHTLHIYLNNNHLHLRIFVY
jgi:hypothetical protein